jgi:hypothetical protein
MDAGFLERFMIGWIIGFAAGLPTSLVVIPLVRGIVEKNDFVAAKDT